MYIEPSTHLTHGHAHEQQGKGHGCPQQAHALHHYQVLQIKYHILQDMIDSKHFYSTHPSYGELLYIVKLPYTIPVEVTQDVSQLVHLEAELGWVL